MFGKGVTTYLVVGLGNPDKQYLDTFHNVGFMVADEFAKMIGAEFIKGECRAITATKKNKDVKIIVAKPITYMNLSGEAVRELINKYKIEKDKFIVVYDDVDLPLGSLRIRMQGSAGTHNGMRDVVAKTGAQDIYRIRLGINRPHEGELFSYVLSRLTQSDLDTLRPAVQKAAKALCDFTDGKDIEYVMREYN